MLITTKHEHGRNYWHYFLRMDNHPMEWLHLYETPLGMICLYGKVMLHRLHFTNLGPLFSQNWKASLSNSRMWSPVWRRTRILGLRRESGGALLLDDLHSAQRHRGKNELGQAEFSPYFASLHRCSELFFVALKDYCNNTWGRGGRMGIFLPSMEGSTERGGIHRGDTPRVP